MFDLKIFFFYVGVLKEFCINIIFKRGLFYGDLSVIVVIFVEKS